MGNTLTGLSRSGRGGRVFELLHSDQLEALCGEVFHSQLIYTAKLLRQNEGFNPPETIGGFQNSTSFDEANCFYPDPEHHAAPGACKIRGLSPRGPPWIDYRFTAGGGEKNVGAGTVGMPGSPDGNGNGSCGCG